MAKIAIDARMVSLANMHGISRYVFELVSRIRDCHSDHEFLILVNKNSMLWDFSWPENMKCLQMESQWISFREQWELRNIIQKYQIDLIHAPSFVAPIFCPCKLVMTIHDLNHIVLRQYYTPLHQIYYKLIVKNCTGNSERVLTVSEFSKKEISRYLDIDAEKIHVTYNGVSERYSQAIDSQFAEYVREFYELPESFILCVSNNKPHKNIHMMIKAYCYSNVDIPLVLACPADAEMIRIAENFGKKHLLHFCRFIDENHLPVVYSLTHLFVYPSTYEGFGLPPLEALACGVPVVVSRASSLPEVVGDCAILTDPFDYRAIAKCLEIGATDLALRESLKVKGIERAAKFRWDRMVEKTITVYDKCLMEDKAVPMGQEVLT